MHGKRRKDYQKQWGMSGDEFFFFICVWFCDIRFDSVLGALVMRLGVVGKWRI